MSTGQVDPWDRSVQHVCMNQGVSFGSVFLKHKIDYLNAAQIRILLCHVSWPERNSIRNHINTDYRNTRGCSALLISLLHLQHIVQYTVAQFCL